MVNDALERRTLEMQIRRMEAQERVLERRLERLAADQTRARKSIEAKLHDELWHSFAG
jgi:hypothetical protein